MMKKVITRMLAFAAVLLCGGAWADYTYNTALTTDWARTDWQIDSVDTLSSLRFSGMMSGSSVNSGNPVPSYGFHVTKQSDGTVNFEMQTSDGYTKSVLVMMKIENGTVYVKGKTDGASYSSSPLGSACFNTEGTRVGSVGTFGSGGYQVASIKATDANSGNIAIDPVAVWTSGFNNLQKQNGVTLNVNSNTATTDSITIGDTSGITIDFDSAPDSATVVVTYKGTIKRTTYGIASVKSGTTENIAGVWQDQNTNVKGWWNTANWTTADVAGKIPSGANDEHTLMFSYGRGDASSYNQLNKGTHLFIDGKAYYIADGLLGKNYTPSGFAIGGFRNAVKDSASGMIITSVKVYNYAIKGDETELRQYLTHWYDFDGEYVARGNKGITFDNNATKPGASSAAYCAGATGWNNTAFAVTSGADAYYSGVSGYGNGSTDWTAIGEFKLSTDSINTAAEESPKVFVGYGRKTGGTTKGVALIARKNAENKPYIQLRAWSNPSSPVDSTDTTVIEDATTRFHSYAVIYDASAKTFSLYVDGESYTSVQMSATVGIGQTVQFGSVYGGGWNSTRCGVTVDDWRVYSKKLTPQQLLAVHQSVKGIREKTDSLSVKLGARTNPKYAVIGPDDYPVGAFPVSGEYWNQTSTAIGNDADNHFGYLELKDGKGAQSTAKLVYRAPNTYRHGSSIDSNPNGRLTAGYFDDSGNANDWTVQAGSLKDGNDIIGESTYTLHTPGHTRGWHIGISEIPYEYYDLYVYLATDQGNFAGGCTFAPIKISTNGGENWVSYVGSNGKTVTGTSNWTGKPFANGDLVEGVNYLKMRISANIMRDLCPQGDIHSIEITHGALSGARVGIAGVQIVKVEDDGLRMRSVGGNWSEAGWTKSNSDAIQWSNATEESPIYALLTASSTFDSITVDADIVARQVILNGEAETFTFTATDNHSVTASSIDATRFTGGIKINATFNGTITLGEGAYIIFDAPDTYTLDNPFEPAPNTVLGGYAKKIGTGVLKFDSDRASSVTLPIHLDEGKILFTGSGTMTMSSALTSAANTQVVKRGAGEVTLSSDQNTIKGLSVEEGTLTLNTADQQLRGNISIEKGAKLINTRTTDALWYGAGENEATVSVKGELDLGATRWTIKKNNVITLYAGSTLSATGQGGNGANKSFDFYNDAHTISVLDNDASTDKTVHFNGVTRFRYADVTFNVADGVTVDVTTDIHNYDGAKTLTKTGAGTLRLSEGADINNNVVISAGALELTGGIIHSDRSLTMKSGSALDLTALTDTSAEIIPGALTLEEGVCFRFPATLNSGATFTLCRGTLTAAQTSIKGAVVYVGETATLANVTIDPEGKTVSYSTSLNEVTTSSIMAAGITSVTIPNNGTLVLDAETNPTVTINATGTIYITKPNAGKWILTDDEKAALIDGITINGDNITIKYWADMLPALQEHYFPVIEGEHTAAQYWSNVYSGPTAGEAAYTYEPAQWSKLAVNGVVPQYIVSTTSERNWSPSILAGDQIPYVEVVDGYKHLTSDNWEGWNLRLGIANGVHMTIARIGKFQGNQDQFIGVDATSKLVTTFAGNQLESTLSVNDCLILDVASKDGIEFLGNAVPSSNAIGVKLYFRGTGETAGSIKVTRLATQANSGVYNLGKNNRVMHVEISDEEIGTGDYKTIKSRKLISFSSSPMTDIGFGDDAVIKIGESGFGTAKRIGSQLSAMDEVGTAQIVKDLDGIYLQWVGRQSATPSLYQWSFAPAAGARTGSWNDVNTWYGIFNSRYLTWSEDSRHIKTAETKNVNFIDEGTDPVVHYVNMNPVNDFEFYFDATKVDSVVVNTTIAASRTGTNPNTGVENQTGYRYIKVVGDSGDVEHPATFKFNLPNTSVDSNVDGVDNEGAPLANFNWTDAATLDIPVDASSFVGELGLRAKITQPITLGSGTKIVFVKPYGDTTIAYPYTIMNADGASGVIEVRGGGTFIVPENMESTVPFEITANSEEEDKGAGYIKYIITGSKTVSAAITGEGGVVKEGEGSLEFIGANTFTGGYTLSAGTLVIPAAETTSVAMSANTTLKLRLTATQQEAGIVVGGITGGSAEAVKFIDTDGNEHNAEIVQEGFKYTGEGSKPYQVNGVKYATLDAAIVGAGDSSEITLVKGITDINIPEGVTIVVNGQDITGTVTGSGKIKYAKFNQVSSQVKTSLQNSNWTGTLIIDGDTAINNGTMSGNYNMWNNFGNSNSTIELTGNISGYIGLTVDSGNELPENIVPIAPELKLSGTVNISDGYSNRNTNNEKHRLTIFDTLSGSGEIYTSKTAADVGYKFAFEHVEDFTGTLDTRGHMKFVLGVPAAEDPFIDYGTITVRSQVNGRATLKSTTLVQFEDTASVDVSESALTVNCAGTVTFGNAINFVGPTSGQPVIKGLTSVPTIPSDIVIKVEGVVQTMAKLAYSDGNLVLIVAPTPTETIDFPAFSNPDYSGANKWLTGFDGEISGKKVAMIGPDGSLVRMLHHNGDNEAEKWHPYKNLGKKATFSVSAYVNLDAATINKPNRTYGVIWEMGHSGDSDTEVVLAYDSSHNLYACNMVDGKTPTSSAMINAEKVTPGWHLVTVTFDTTNGTKIYLDNGVASGMSAADTSSNTAPTNNGFQFGGIYGGTNNQSTQAHLVGLAKAIFFDSVLTASEVQALSEYYPAVSSEATLDLSAVGAETTLVYTGTRDITVSDTTSNGGVYVGKKISGAATMSKLQLAENAIVDGAANLTATTFTAEGAIKIDISSLEEVSQIYNVVSATIVDPSALNISFVEARDDFNIVKSTTGIQVVYGTNGFLNTANISGTWILPEVASGDVQTTLQTKTRTIASGSPIKFEMSEMQDAITINMLVDIATLDSGNGFIASIQYKKSGDEDNATKNYANLAYNSGKLALSHSSNSAVATASMATSGVHMLTLTVHYSEGLKLYVDGSSSAALTASGIKWTTGGTWKPCGTIAFGTGVENQTYFVMNGTKYYAIDIKSGANSTPDMTVVSTFLPEDVRNLSAEAQAAIIKAGLKNDGYTGGAVTPPTATVGGEQISYASPEYAELMETTGGQSISLPKVTIDGDEVTKVSELYDLYKLTGRTGNDTYAFVKPNFTTPAQSVNPDGMTLSVALPTALNGTDGNLVLKAKSGEGVWKRIGSLKPGAEGTANFDINFADILYGSAKSATFKLDATTKVPTLPHDLVMLANAPIADGACGWTTAGKVDRTTTDATANSGALYRIVAVAKGNGMITTMYDARSNFKDLGQDIVWNDWAGNDSFDNGNTWSPARLMIDVPNWGDSSQGTHERKECDLIDPCLGYDANRQKFVVMGLTGGGLAGSTQAAYADNNDLVIYERDAVEGSQWVNRTSVEKDILDALEVAMGDDETDWTVCRGVLQGPGHAYTTPTDLVRGDITIPAGTPIFAMQYFQGFTTPNYSFVAWYTIENGNMTWHTTKLTMVSGGHEPSVTVLDDGSLYMIAKAGSRWAFRSTDYVNWVRCADAGASQSVQGSILKIGSKNRVGTYAHATCTSGRAQIKVFIGTDNSSIANTANSAPVTWNNSEAAANVWPNDCWTQGYTTMFMVDEHTLGVIFEVQSHVYFQAVDVSTYVD